jgi:hypothetical protein
MFEEIRPPVVVTEAPDPRDWGGRIAQTTLSALRSAVAAAGAPSVVFFEGFEEDICHVAA